MSVNSHVWGARKLPTMSQLREVLRGLSNSLVAKVVTPSKLKASDALIIAGYPRSGTTWLAELVSSIPRTGVIFEPLSIEHVRQARTAGLDWQNFHLPSDDWAEGRAFFDKVLRGSILTPWTASTMSLYQTVRVQRWVIKMVRANQMLGWISENFRTKPAALIIRHPCAVLASREARGWPTPTFPPSSAEFFAAYPHLEEFVKTREFPEEHFATRWCLNHYAPLELPEPRPFIPIFYENLLLNPASELKRLCDVWDIRLPERMGNSAARASTKASVELRENGPRLDRWKSSLSQPRIRRVLSVLKEFGLDFYGSDCLPDFRRLESGVNPGGDNLDRI